MSSSTVTPQSSSESDKNPKIVIEIGKIRIVIPVNALPFIMVGVAILAIVAAVYFLKNGAI